MGLIGGEYSPGELLLHINQETNVLVQERIAILRVDTCNQERLAEINERLEELAASRNIVEGYLEEDE